MPPQKIQKDNTTRSVQRNQEVEIWTLIRGYKDDKNVLDCVDEDVIILK